MVRGNSENLILQTELQEIWVYREPKKAEHIRVNRGFYSHHGIYISDIEVIHFTGQDDDNIMDWSKNEVISTTLQEFLRGGILEVKEYTEDEFNDLYLSEDIINYARASIGDRDYNLVFNNCEHFANVCTLGRFTSSQVEKVLNILREPVRKRRGGDFMGIGSWLGNLFRKGKSSAGGTRTTESKMYEPDKIKIAEIERDTKIRLAHLEKEKIQLMTEVQLELLEKEYYFKVAYEEAKAKGLQNVAQTFISMNDKLNDIYAKRLQIIESGSIKIVKDIENFYLEIEEKINKDNDKYNNEKLPNLLNLLENFEEGTIPYKIYSKRIEDDVISHMENQKRQLDNMTLRQNQLIESLIKSKDKIIDNSLALNKEIIDKLIEEKSTESEGLVVSSGINDKKLLQ